MYSGGQKLQFSYQLQIIQYKRMINLRTARSFQKLWRFSNSNDNDKVEIETLSIKRNTILNLKQLSYQPKKKLQFKDGKCLIYQNKRKWYTQTLLFSHLYAAFGYLAYMMKYNPFYLSFPASLPIMIGLEFFVLRRIFLKQKKYRNLVSKIYLLQNGEVIEVHFANRVYRQLKGLPLERLYFVSNLLNPDSSTDHKPIPTSVKEFPQNEKIQDIQPLDYAWTKYFLNWDNFLMIPIRADYMNMEVLSKVFSGKRIVN